MKKILVAIFFVVGLVQLAYSDAIWSAAYPVGDVYVTNTVTSQSDPTPGPPICATPVNGIPYFMAFFVDEKTEHYLKVLLEAKATGKKVRYWYYSNSGPTITWLGEGSYSETEGLRIMGVAIVDP